MEKKKVINKAGKDKKDFQKNKCKSIYLITQHEKKANNTIITIHSRTSAIMIICYFCNGKIIHRFYT